MALTNEDILNAVSEMSVMQIVELISAMEEKFGVTAAAATVVGAFIDPIVPVAGSNAINKALVTTGKWAVKTAIAGKSAAYIVDDIVSPIVEGVAETLPKKHTEEDTI